MSVKASPATTNSPRSAALRVLPLLLPLPQQAGHEGKGISCHHPLLPSIPVPHIPSSYPASSCCCWQCLDVSSADTSVAASSAASFTSPCCTVLAATLPAGRVLSCPAGCCAGAGWLVRHASGGQLLRCCLLRRQQ